MVLQSGAVRRAVDPAHEEGVYLSRREPLLEPAPRKMAIRGGSKLEMDSATASHSLSWLAAMAVIRLMEDRGSEMWL